MGVTKKEKTKRKGVCDLILFEHSKGLVLFFLSGHTSSKGEGCVHLNLDLSLCLLNGRRGGIEGLAGLLQTTTNGLIYEKKQKV